MIENSEHVDFEVLSELVDGELDHRTATVIQEHVTRCQECSARFESLRTVLSDVGRLPRSVLPPDDIWPELREALQDRKNLVLRVPGKPATGAVGSTTRAGIPWRLGAILAIAAVILVIVSSGITALVLRRDSSRLAVIPRGEPAAPMSPGSAQAAPTLRANFRQTEQEFTRTIEELRLAVDTQRGQLSPETVRTVDHSLAVVDSAIAEAREALRADPNNQMLVDLLSTTYQRKLDLLRRTSELGSRT